MDAAVFQLLIFASRPLVVFFFFLHPFACAFGPAAASRTSSRASSVPVAAFSLAASAAGLAEEEGHRVEAAGDALLLDVGEVAPHLPY